MPCTLVHICAGAPAVQVEHQKEVVTYLLEVCTCAGLRQMGLLMPVVSALRAVSA